MKLQRVRNWLVLPLVGVKSYKGVSMDKKTKESNNKKYDKDLGCQCEHCKCAEEEKEKSYHENDEKQLSLWEQMGG